MKKFMFLVVLLVTVSLVHGWWFSTEADIFPEEDVTAECLRQADWGRCEFYECLERRFPCGSDGYINRVALHFCHKVATIFDSFNERGRQWMNGTSRCLTTSLRQIYNSDQTTCSAIKEAGAESLTSCNARVERDGSNFCDFVQENTDAYQSIFSTSDISRMVGMRKPGYTIYHLFEYNKNPVVVPDLGPFWLGEKPPDDTNHLTQPHSMGSNTACWFIGKYGLSNAISEDPNEVTEFCGVF